MMSARKQFLENTIYHIVPFLVALFPVLHIYSANIFEVSISSLMYVLPKILYATLATYLVLYGIFRDFAKASFLCSLAIILYFSYGVFDLIAGYAYLALAYFPLFSTLHYKVEAVIYAGVYLTIFTVLAGYLWSHHNPANSKRMWGAVFFTLVIMVGAKGGRILFREVHIRSVNAELTHVTTESTQQVDEENYPDIYYLILDRYGREDILQRDYNFDNSDFLAKLDAEGFFIADQSTTNYPKTYLSVASSLNGQYLSDLLPPDVLQEQDQTFVFKAMQDSWFLQLVKERGYTTYQAGGWWGETRINRYADHNVNLYATSDEFIAMLMATTFNKPLSSMFAGTQFADNFFRYSNPPGYDNLTYQIEQIKEISQSPDHTYLFMHVLSIHEPYIFDEKCAPGSVAQLPEYDQYIVQLGCTNELLTDLIETILDDPQQPVIIVLQSDEGPITHDTIETNWLENSPENLQRHLSIFNAIYSTEPLDVYKDITPVNTFRIIARDIYGVPIEPLPDRNYVYSSIKEPLNVTDVTEQIHTKLNDVQ